MMSGVLANRALNNMVAEPVAIGRPTRPEAVLVSSQYRLVLREFGNLV